MARSALVWSADLAIMPEGELPDGFDRIEGVPLTHAQLAQALGRVTVDARHADGVDGPILEGLAQAAQRLGQRT